MLHPTAHTPQVAQLYVGQLHLHPFLTPPLLFRLPYFQLDPCRVPMTSPFSPLFIFFNSCTTDYSCCSSSSPSSLISTTAAAMIFLHVELKINPAAWELTMGASVLRLTFASLALDPWSSYSSTMALLLGRPPRKHEQPPPTPVFSSVQPFNLPPAFTFCSVHFFPTVFFCIIYVFLCKNLHFCDILEKFCGQSSCFFTPQDTCQLTWLNF